MLVNTSILTGPALNFAVATAQGLSVSFADWYKPDEGCQLQVSRSASGIDSIYWHLGGRYDPAGDWAQGGPLLEKENIDIMHVRQADLSVVWCATLDSGEIEFTGPTALIAAMRAFVSQKLGDTLKIPNELI